MKTLPTFTKSVPFVDTDMAGIVHFSKVLCYVEEAEHAAMSAIGVAAISDIGGFPKVRIECDYKSPLKFQDSLSVDLSLVKVGNRSLNWKFRVSANQRIAAEGSIVTVFTSLDSSASGMIEGEMRQRLLEYLSQE